MARADVTEEHVQGFLTHLWATFDNGNTIGKYFGCVVRELIAAGAARGLGSTPVTERLRRAVKRTRKTTVERARPMDVETLERLVEEALSTGDEAMACALALAFWGGFRLGELVPPQRARNELPHVVNGDVRIVDGGELAMVLRYDKVNHFGSQVRHLRLERVSNSLLTDPATRWAAWSASGGADGAWLGGLTYERCAAFLVRAMEAQPESEQRPAALGVRADFSGHSFRRGFVQLGLRLGASFEDIARVTGHKDLSSLTTYAYGLEAGAGVARRLAQRRQRQDGEEQQAPDPVGKSAGASEEEDELEYEVKAVVGVEFGAGGGLLWRVLWSDGSESWEPDAHLEGARGAVDAFLAARSCLA